MLPSGLHPGNCCCKDCKGQRWWEHVLSVVSRINPGYTSLFTPFLWIRPALWGGWESPRWWFLLPGSLSTVMGGRLILTSAARVLAHRAVWSLCHLGVVTVTEALCFWLAFLNNSFQSTGAQSCHHLAYATALTNLSLRFLSRRWGEAVINP